MRSSVSITPSSVDASMGIMAQDHRSGEVRMYAPMMYRKARGEGPREYPSTGQKL